LEELVASIFNVEDGGSSLHWNVGMYLSNYVASPSRRP
jgi:hypothetical protein